MPPPRIQLSMPRMMVLVAIAGWVAFNLRLWLTIETALPAGLASRVDVFRGLTWLLAPVMGGTVAARIWRGLTGPVDSTRMAVRRGGQAGAGGGALAWFVATSLLCVGHDANGDSPAIAVIMAGLGAACNAAGGAVLGFLWWQARPRPAADRENEFLR